MSTARPMTMAMGGEREVPSPDPIARDYLLLALRLGQHLDGLVDGYFGPADLKARVDMEPLRPAARLADDAAALAARLPAEVDEPDRRAWLAAQLGALEAQSQGLAGDPRPYTDHVARCFDFRPTRHGEAAFRAVAAQLEAVVPGAGDVRERLDALDRATVIPADRVAPIAEWLVAAFRARSDALFGLPRGERLRLGLVRDQPWSGYNWYEGGLRSRVDLNLDLPIRAADLVHVMAHETYPGHHLEHAWKEADLVATAGRLEASILLINTPECFVSEGLADAGHQFAAPPETEGELLAEVLARAGSDQSLAPVLTEVAALRRSLGAVAVDAALLRHADAASHEDVLAFLIDVGLMHPDRAAKRLAFIEHPLWRTYVFVYSEGAALLERWLAAASATEAAARFARLLHEQLTPSGIAAELAG